MPTGKPSKPPSPARLSTPDRDASLAAAIERWFRGSARDLPWRAVVPALRHRDPYLSLVSEFMLQQTQVSRVLEKFAPFIERFPDANALAAAPEHDVLAMWSGLGYYRRAKLLHAAAKAIALHHAGTVPNSAAALRDLPGIGAYTAGAISSIVFGHQEPLADGNVARVLLRLDAKAALPPSAPATMKWVWARAADLLATPAGRANPGGLNEGLMELGATVCTPRAPACDSCPLRASCLANAKGLQAKIPAPKTPAPRKPLLAVSIVLRNRAGHILLEQRPRRGMWAGLWQAPSLEQIAADLPAVRRELTEQLRQSLGLRATPAAGPVFEHATSHRSVVFVTFSSSATPHSPGPDRQWIPRERLHEFGMSNAHRKVIDLALNH